MTQYKKHSLYNLHGYFSRRTVVLILAKKVTNNLPKYPEQKFGQTQQQIFNLSKISIHKLQGQCIVTYENIRGKIRSDIKLINV